MFVLNWTLFLPTCSAIAVNWTIYCKQFYNGNMASLYVANFVVYLYVKPFYFPPIFDITLMLQPLNKNLCIACILKGQDKELKIERASSN